MTPKKSIKRTGSSRSGILKGGGSFFSRGRKQLKQRTQSTNMEQIPANAGTGTFVNRKEDIITISASTQNHGKNGDGNFAWVD